MQSMNSTNENTFSVYQPVDPNSINEKLYAWDVVYFDDRPLREDKELKKIYNETIPNKELLTKEDYSTLRVNLKIENDIKTLYSFNFRFLEDSYNNDILVKALKEIQSNPLHYNKYSFVDRCINKIHYGKDELNKCKFFINSGLDVNLGTSYDLKTTALERSLSLPDNSFAELLLKSGGIVRHKLKKDEQDRVNKIMQPYIDKINVIVELAIDKNSPIKNFPWELKNIFFSMTTERLELLPSVVLRILKMYNGRTPNKELLTKEDFSISGVKF
jgi:hypothetical protein